MAKALAEKFESEVARTTIAERSERPENFAARSFSQSVTALRCCG
jgi:hypothetical protein